MKKKQNDALASRQQRKKIGQKHLKKAITKTGVATLMKETDPQDNMEGTRSTGPIVNYQEGQNIPAKEHKLNLSDKTNNLMMYNGITREVYIENQERVKPESYNNHNTERPRIYLDKPKQEIPRKDRGEQEVRKTEIMKRFAEI